MDLRIERHRLVTTRFPDYWPGWFLYGDALHHFGSEKGYDWTEALEAFQRAVAVNPKLVPAWVHIHDVTLGKDQAEARRAEARLAEFGLPPPENLHFRLLVEVDRAGGVIPQGLRLADSMAGLMASVGGEARMHSGYLGLTVLMHGFPAAQIQLNDRALKANSLSPLVRTALEAANAWAWAARGRWDSALTIMETAARKHPGVIGPPKLSSTRLAPISGSPLAVESYGLSVIGAWLGAVAPGLADRRRPRAVAAVAQLADEESRREALGRLAWLDGILGFARGDRQTILSARRDAARSEYYQAEVVDRSLTAFEHALAGERRRAGNELATLVRECADRIESCNSLIPPSGVHRLAAAQWLAETGDVEQARRLLRWIDAEATYIPPVLATLFFTVGAPTYLARARLEETAGEPRRALEFYRQFLRRYDQPMASQVHLVEEARAALARLEVEP